jgi:hypothetical protein
MTPGKKRDICCLFEVYRYTLYTRQDYWPSEICNYGNHWGCIAGDKATNQSWHIMAAVHPVFYKPFPGLYQWPFQDPKLEVPTIYKAYVRPMQGDIPRKYGLIWYSTSILGSWNGHWLYNNWLVVWIIFNLSIYGEVHHPNWLLYFSEG